MLLANIDDLRVAHERVQVDLVDRWQGDTLVDELLDVLCAEVGHLPRSAVYLHVEKRQRRD